MTAGDTRRVKQTTCRALALQLSALGKQQPNAQENTDSEEHTV